MTLIVLSCFWVIAGAVVACLPLRYQYVPGLVLIAAAPVLILLAGAEFGGLAALAATMVVVSMFRKPLGYIWHQARARILGDVR